MKKIALSLLVFFSLITITYAQSELETIIDKYGADTLLNGSVIVAQNGNILYQGSFGYADIETNKSITSTTLFPIASLTKQFTAAAIMILQEKGKLSINDNIIDYLNVPPSMQPVTIKNLMNHSSGIPDYWPNNIDNNKDSIMDFHFNNDTLLFSPNTNYSYCNSAYFLLGLIIEKVSGKSYNDFLNENIFTPIGMSHTFVNDGNKCIRAIGYNENWEKNDYLMTTADGGIISNVDDLFLWDQALSKNEILSEESKTMMFEPLKLENGKVINYGFGWDINENNRNIVSHTGWLASFGAYNQYDEKTNKYIILLSNRILPELMDLINDINGELYK
jgi:CubicO group peptidase (beta-lactamase class C family)